MKIGIIGSGNVGGALGTRWARNGHEVIFSSRHPQSPEVKAVAAGAGPSARTGTIAAAAAAEVILLATPWHAAEEALQSAGSLKGKVLIDAVNPLLPDLSGLAAGTTTSAGEHVAQWAPGAKVVKAFNTVGANIMANPGFGVDRPVMFYCGDDEAAKQTVHSLIAELDFEPIDAGPLTQARLLEPFAMLWISLAFARGFRTEIAFKFLRR